MRANQFLESISVDDNFDIEFDNFVIESSVVGFTEDGVVIEADSKALALLSRKAWTPPLISRVA